MSFFETIRDFPDYEISASNSDIRRRGSDDVKKHVEQFIGRKKIELMKEGKRHNRLVAELMYQTFIGDVPVGKNIYLKNGRDTEHFGIDDIEALTKAEKVANDKEYRKGLLDHGWREHPLYKNHMVNEAGDVYGLHRGKVQTGHVREDGYVDLGIDGQTKSYHRFVWEAWNGTCIPDGHDIDHINNNTQDNRLCNLQLLSRPEHNAKTFADTEKRRQVRADRASKAVIRRKVLEDGSFGSIEDFSSQLIAGEITGLDRRDIAKNIGSIWQGYLWQYRPVEEIENEVWKAHEDIEVSNKGRVKRDGIVSRGRLTRESGEYMLYKNRKRLFVKTLICRAFNGPPLTNSSPEVRHIDGDIRNNAADNLVWSTHQEGVEHSKNVNAIIVYYTDNKAIYYHNHKDYIFKTATAASKHFNIDSKNIGTICKEGTKCRLHRDGRLLDFLYLKDCVLRIGEHSCLYLESTTRPSKADRRYGKNKF